MTYPNDFEQKLGFDQIRQRLRNYTLSPLGNRLVDEMAFSSSYSEVKKRLHQNLEFKQLLQKSETFPSANYFDPTELWPTVAIEGTFIEEDAFYQLILSLHTIFEGRFFLTKNKEVYPELYALSEPVLLDKKVLVHLQSKFDDTGKVRDTASQELSKIRKRLREEQSRVRRLTDQIFRSVADQGFTPDGVSPTIRDGRVVIPLLAEHKRKIRGFIVDESATGQTVYMEPAEVLEANNEIRDLVLAERREIVKILKELTADLRVNLSQLMAAYQFLGQMDFARARAKFSIDIDATLPYLKEHPDLNWLGARHPLLFLSLRGKRPVVPLTIDLTSKEKFLLVSGPNAGGKSVVLKTTGLVQYMLQCGLLVPLQENSTAGIFKKILLDIGDQQSIENDLSTYSSHLRNMNFFLRNADENTLVLMDELGSGTDPNFGGGIAQAILTSLVRKKVWGVATTHYYNLKLFASNEEGIRNGAMLFDSKKLEPLFSLEIGKPGSSFALEIARKTGLPYETLQSAENIIGKDLTGLETLMKTVADEKQQATKKILELQQKEKKLNEELNRYQQLSGGLELRKKEIIDKAKAEASNLLKDTNREIEKTIRHIKENKAEKKETKKVREGLKELVDKIQPVAKPVEKVNEVLKEGDKVRLHGQEVTGTILSIKGNNVMVQFGELRSTVKMNQLVRSDLVEYDPVKKARSLGLNIHERQSHFSSTLDIRGKRVEETITLLDQFIDNAVLLGQGELKILHGKGEGVLRKVVRDHLRKVKAVASVADEHVERGGDGISIVILK
ncbi:MAG: endonuclease MutS2 [Azospira oryzae]|jgi:DNA mismatch repair protein MutS2|nr:MAG: endonuclease MutS2 [Azospira oryzae]